jgi:acetylornithine/N-succinyldiaminopimelate aminotransferase
MTMGKGIAGRFPFAAFAALAVSASVDKQLNKGGHSGTFCGKPLACAVVAALISHLRAENMADKVARTGKFMIDGLHKLKDKYPSLFGPIRGKGLLCAFDLGSDHLVTKITEAALSRRLLVTPTGNRIIRLIPPLIVAQA